MTLKEAIPWAIIAVMLPGYVRYWEAFIWIRKEKRRLQGELALGRKSTEDPPK